MMLPNFIGASYASTAREVDVEDCVNLYPEIQESPGAKAETVLYGSPGTHQEYDFRDINPTDAGPIRGVLEVEAITYVVSSIYVYRIDAAGIVTQCIGTISAAGGTMVSTIDNDARPVSMVADVSELLITSADVAYVIQGTQLYRIADPPWNAAIDCEFLDGYFIVLDDTGLPAGGQFFISSQYNALSGDPLDFSNAPASNNKLRALRVDHNELWVFGTIISQVFYNNGNADFPFVPNPSGIVMQGIESRDARQQMDNTLFWVGRNKDGQLQAFSADGYTPRRISNFAIERQWQRYADTTDIVAWTYQMDGHTVYHVNFINAGKSWRFDRATGQWHRVAFRNPTTGIDECHRGNNHSVRNGVHLVGDRELPIALRRAPAIFKENKNIFFRLFELITPGGIGNGTASTPETNPVWMLRWSNDNGFNWTQEFQLLAGRLGEYGTRLRKVGCGMARNRVFEVSISADVPRCLIGANVEIEGGVS